MLSKETARLNVEKSLSTIDNGFVNGGLSRLNQNFVLFATGHFSPSERLNNSVPTNVLTRPIPHLLANLKSFLGLRQSGFFKIMFIPRKASPRLLEKLAVRLKQLERESHNLALELLLNPLWRLAVKIPILARDIPKKPNKKCEEADHRSRGQEITIGKGDTLRTMVKTGQKLNEGYGLERMEFVKGVVRFRLNPSCRFTIFFPTGFVITMLLKF